MTRPTLSRRGPAGAILALLAAVSLPLLPQSCSAQSVDAAGIVETSLSTRTAPMRQQANMMSSMSLLFIESRPTRSPFATPIALKCPAIRATRSCIAA